jgi:hypothetical protein
MTTRIMEILGDVLFIDTGGWGSGRTREQVTA